MNEAPVDAVQEAAALAGPSAGAMLRSAREASGLHIAALAVALKVPVKRLEALEADRWDLLPDAVFVRALASSVCRALELVPAPVLDRLPRSATPVLQVQEGGINSPFRAPGDKPRMPLPAWLSGPAGLVVAVLLLGAIGIAFYPQSLVATAAGPGLVRETGAPPVDSAATAAPVAQAASAVSTAAAPGAEVLLAAAVATPVIVFRSSGPSWIEVTDASGVAQLRKTLVAGESAAASGALPLSVVVGRADVTLVEVRGKPWSMAEAVRDNVARFEVK